MKYLLRILLFSTLYYGQISTASSEYLLKSITAKDVRPYTNVTLLKVLANPDRYDDTTLKVIGYLNLSFESNGLYLHKEDFDYAIYGNALRIDASAEIYEQLKKFNNQYVVIEGHFRDRGTTLFAGQLTNIESCELRQKRQSEEAPLYITLDPKR